jgi:hypothetical protein
VVNYSGKLQYFYNVVTGIPEMTPETLQLSFSGFEFSATKFSFPATVDPTTAGHGGSLQLIIVTFLMVTPEPMPCKDQ